MGEDFPRRFDEEPVLPTLIREQTDGQRKGLGLVGYLVAGSPERTPRIKRIQHHVAPGFVIKLRQIFHRRVVHDGRFAALPNLREYLSYCRALASAAVSYDEEVHRLAVARNPRPATQLIAHDLVDPVPFLIDERDAIRQMSRQHLRLAQLLVELRRRHQLRPA